MKKTLIIIFLACACYVSNAQQPVFTSEAYPQLNYKGLLGEVNFKPYMQVKGSPYLSGDWLPGKLFLGNGDTLTNLQIRYDFYKQQVLVYQKYLKRIILVDKFTVNGFSVALNGKNLLFKKEIGLKSKANANNGCFVEILSTGNVSLYKIYYDQITPLSSPEGTFIDEFVPGTEYKLKVDTTFQNIKLRKASIVRSFPQYKKQIKRYIRKNRLKPKKENDFSKIVTFVDALYSSNNNAVKQKQK